MTKADVQEALVTLYLRLNGYFTTGFIVHSPVQGKNRTEVDILAVRLPHNAEPSRGVGGASELDRWDEGIDFIIGEVKSHRQPKQFNSATKRPECVKSILEWWGHLRPEEVELVAPQVLQAMNLSAPASAAPTVGCPRGSRIRPMLFSPETRNRRKGQAWFIPGPPIFGYIHRCLHPSEPRPECATDYGAGQWGIGLERIVKYFKSNDRTEPGDFRDLSRFLSLGED